MLDMPTRSLHRSVIALIALATTAVPGLAQYDRDGKYVPSPMGVPADPYAKPIPNYSGKPGAVIGTPSGPRIAPYQQPNALAPRPEVPITRRPSNTLPVALTVEQCEDGWSNSTRIPRVEFNRRCRVILRKR
ncbi:MAG: hypothetical protein ABL908_23505 [Hyphomicrobium sp.]